MTTCRDACHSRAGHKNERSAPVNVLGGMAHAVDGMVAREVARDRVFESRLIVRGHVRPPSQGAPHQPHSRLAVHLDARHPCTPKDEGESLSFPVGNKGLSKNPLLQTRQALVSSHPLADEVVPKPTPHLPSRPPPQGDVRSGKDTQGGNGKSAFLASRIA